MIAQRNFCLGNSPFRSNYQVVRAGYWKMSFWSNSKRSLIWPIPLPWTWTKLSIFQRSPRKFIRSVSSLKIFLCSMPLAMMWCRAPGASIRALSGMLWIFHTPEKRETYNLMGVPLDSLVPLSAGLGNLGICSFRHFLNIEITMRNGCLRSFSH